MEAKGLDMIACVLMHLGNLTRSESNFFVIALQLILLFTDD